MNASLTTPRPSFESPRTENAVERDVVRLVALNRRTGSYGELLSARHIAHRLRENGVADAAITTFDTQTSWVPAHLAHIATTRDAC